MKIIDKLKKVMYKFYNLLYENTYGFSYARISITQEEADALFDLLDSYGIEDLEK